MKVKCKVCSKTINVKPSRLKRVKHGITCSKKCFGLRQKVQMKGKGNHQFGLKNELNSSFKSNIRISNYGYIMVRNAEHPYCNIDGFCKEHRLIVEKYYYRYNREYFVDINGSKYLKQNIIVHHRDENKLNNNINNLVPMSKSAHITLHNKKTKLLRDNKGRIIGVLKLDELLGNPEEDNQQPSLMNMHKSSEEGSETNE